ncbi:MAG: adenylate/guanylate cyclase domain-containing protein [Chlorobiota bacterium]
MKTTILALIILLSINITYQAHAQLSAQTKIDSLLAKLPNAKGDTNEVKLLYYLSYSYHNINPDKGIEYGKRSLSLSNKLDWKKGLANSYNSLSANMVRKSEFPNAFEYSNKALKINEELGNKRGITENLTMMAVIFTYQSKYSKALEYYKKALIIDEEIGNKNGEAGILANIGSIYFYQNNLSQTLEYMIKASRIYEELGNKEGNALTLGNIGAVFEKQSNYPKALEYYGKSLVFKEELGNKYGIATTLGNMGSLYLTISHESITIKPAELNKYISLNKLINLNKSIEYTLEAIKIYEEIGELNGRSEFLNNLSEAYYLKEDYKKAYDALEEHHKLKDSVFNQENSDKIAALEKAREDDLKQKEIEKQKLKIAEQEKREKLILYFSIGFIIVMAVVMFIIYRLLKRSDKLLYNVLPVSIAKRLKKREHPISDYFTQASIVFIDIVNFTEMAKDEDPRRVVEALNKIFTNYDTIANKYGLEKIKTIGDSYMAAAGIPEVQKNNTHRAAQMALEVKQLMNDYRTADGTKIEVRIGLDCGPVVAGVIGENKFIYDMWSDAVNTASRMETSSEAGQVHITDRFREAVSEYEEFEYVERGEIEIKGKGMMKTYYIEERKVEVV